MRVVLTTCTAEKHPQQAPLPARERYLGARIDHAGAHARALGVPWFIFSGVYGLLSCADPVPWYDHALQPSEVEREARRLSLALVAREITAVVAILEHRGAPGWAPYHDVLTEGCRQAGVRLAVEAWPSGG